MDLPIAITLARDNPPSKPSESSCGSKSTTVEPENELPRSNAKFAMDNIVNMSRTVHKKTLNSRFMTPSIFCSFQYVAL